MSYEHLGNNTENTAVVPNNERSVMDVEDIVSPLINSPG